MAKVKICPKCESDNVKVDTNPRVAAGFSHTIYLCLNCGFNSPIFPEIEKRKV